MKLIEKHREGSKVRKKYDAAQTPCDRLLNCLQVPEETKKQLRKERKKLDPIRLAEEVEEKLKGIYARVEEIEARRREQRIMSGEWAEEEASRDGDDFEGAEAPVASAPSASAPSKSEQNLAKGGKKTTKQAKSRVS